MSIILLFLAVFSSCQKSDTEEYYESHPEVEETSAVYLKGLEGLDISAHYPVNVTRAENMGGNLYQIALDLPVEGDTDENPQVSIVRLFEDGKELAYAHSTADDIKKSGKGRYRHYNGGLLFSSSDNSDPRTNKRVYTISASTDAINGAERPQQSDNAGNPMEDSQLSNAIQIDVTRVALEGGYSFKLKNIPFTGDSGTQPNASKLKVFENGVEIGPAHASHASIQNSGKGRFSHWGDILYFSSSDNSDPRTNGRVYHIGTGAAPVIKPVDQSQAPTVYGYAMVNGKTTGGLGGQVVTVTTKAELEKAAKYISPLIIQVSGTIKGTGSIYLTSNKTLIGINGGMLDGIGIYIFESSNIIIRNLKIRNVVSTDDNDAINIKFGSHHIWVDHCELWADRNHGWEYYDGLIDIARTANYVTISWSKLHDSHIPMMMSTQDKGKNPNVTLHHNYIYNTSERNPDMTNGYIHCFNNYFENVSGYTIAAVEDGTVRTDNNYFKNNNQPIITTYNGRQPGYISGANTNIFENSGRTKITTPASDWLPPYEYKSILIPAKDVPSVVKAGAGATLNL